MRWFSSGIPLIGLVLLTGCQQGDPPIVSTSPASTLAAQATPTQYYLPKTIPMPEIFGKPHSRPGERNDPSGTWRWYSPFDPTLDYALRLEVEGERVTGGMTARKSKEVPIFDAHFRNGELTFSVSRENSVWRYSGRVQGDTIRGSVEVDNGMRRRDWEAIRER
jgi:hypothetical protein